MGPLLESCSLMILLYDITVRALWWRESRAQALLSAGSKSSGHSEAVPCGIDRWHHRHTVPTVPWRATCSHLWNFRPILLARACSSNTVWPQAALISFHSTGTLGKRPSLKLLIVPNCPLCLQKGRGAQGEIEIIKRLRFPTFTQNLAYTSFGCPKPKASFPLFFSSVESQQHTSFPDHFSPCK